MTTIADALRLFIEPGQVTELRAPDVPTGNNGYTRTHSGYFNDLDKMAAEAKRLDDLSAPGVYFVPNPIDHALLARCANRCQPVTTKGNSTAGHNVERRHWLMIDAGVPEPGLRVRLELADGTVLERAAVVGGSWLSSEDPRLHFGLGSHTEIAVVEVTRADGTVEVFEDVVADQVLALDALLNLPFC